MVWTYFFKIDPKWKNLNLNSHLILKILKEELLIQIIFLNVIAEDNEGRKDTKNLNVNVLNSNGNNPIIYHVDTVIRQQWEYCSTTKCT